MMNGHNQKTLDIGLLRWAVSRFTNEHKSIKLVYDIDLSNLSINNADVLSSYRRVKYLNLSANKLSSIEFLRNFYRLNILLISNNNMEKLFMDNVAFSATLKILDASYNKISVLPNFKQFTELTDINLERNFINDLNGLRFCSKLTNLNISFNMIETLTPLSKCPLVQLDVSHNQLISLAGIDKITSLCVLTARNNQIDNCNEFNEELRNLKTVNLENNLIKDLENIESINKLAQLKSINLVNNPIYSKEEFRESSIKKKLTVTDDYKPESSEYLRASSRLKDHTISILVGPRDHSKARIVHNLLEKYPDELYIIKIYTNMPDNLCYKQEYNDLHKQVMEKGVYYSICQYHIHVTNQDFNRLKMKNQFGVIYKNDEFSFGIPGKELAPLKNVITTRVMIIEFEGFQALRSKNFNANFYLLLPSNQKVLEDRLLDENRSVLLQSPTINIIKKEIQKYQIYQQYQQNNSDLFSDIIISDDLNMTSNSVEKLIKPDSYQEEDEVIEKPTKQVTINSTIEEEEENETDRHGDFQNFRKRFSIHNNRGIRRRDSTIKLALFQRLETIGLNINDCKSILEIDGDSLLEKIEKHVIGRDKTFSGPFGKRLIVYCDYTASGKALDFIENFILHEVLPNYANTHTTNTMTSLQTTSFRYEARNIIKKSLNCGEDDVVIFAGSGCTGGLHKLIHNVTVAKDTCAPIVIHGPFEHHSNVVPWRFVAAVVRRIGVTNDGQMDLEDLESALKELSAKAQDEGRVLVCSFSASSNVTGILTDTNKVSAMVHRYEGIVFWDYAAAGPYVKMDMNPVVDGPDKELVYKDAIVFSTHKFIGGVGTPGILAAKKFLFEPGEIYPHGAGGGTVFYVGREKHLYLKDVEEREEGGTPEIVGSIRAGLAIQLKQAIGTNIIEKTEDDLVKMAWSKFAACSDKLIILGGKTQPRIPIFSFLIRQKMPNNKFLFLHHNFICVLLNDLFGIQSRSGCACAGPYGMDIMGLNEDLAVSFMDLLIGESCPTTGSVDHPNNEIMKPGFTRINLPYFLPLAELEFVIDAIIFVVKYGIYFLPLYNFQKNTGSWNFSNTSGYTREKVVRLTSITMDKSHFSHDHKHDSESIDEEIVPSSFKDVMRKAYMKYEELRKDLKDLKIDDSDTEDFNAEEQKLRWFIVPSEAIKLICGTGQLNDSLATPFNPGELAEAFVGNCLDEVIELENDKDQENEPINASKSIKDQYLLKGYKEVFMHKDE